MDEIDQRDEEEQSIQITPTFPHLSYDSEYDTDQHKRSMSSNFAAKDQQFGVLWAMCIGYPDLAARLEQPPFSWHLRKHIQDVYRPVNAQLADEIHRRVHFMRQEIPLGPDHPIGVVNKGTALKSPRPNNWKTPQIVKWLEERPMELDERDIDFASQMLDHLGQRVTFLHAQESSHLYLGSRETPLLVPTEPPTETAIEGQCIQHTSDLLQRFEMVQRLNRVTGGLKEDANFLVSDKMALVTAEGNCLQALAAMRKRRDKLWSKKSDYEIQLARGDERSVVVVIQSKLDSLTNDIETEEDRMINEEDRLTSIREQITKKDEEIATLGIKLNKVMPPRKLVDALRPRARKKQRVAPGNNGEL